MAIGDFIVVSAAAKMWFNKKGQLHREDGPAIEWLVCNQLTQNEWHLDGVKLSKEQFDTQIAKIQLNKNLKINLISKEDIDKKKLKV